MFGRKRKSQLRAYRSARPEDQLVLAALVDAGADLAAPRHVLHFIYDLADEATAGRAATGAADWEATVGPPPDGYDTWSVTFERSGYVLTPENVAADADTFSALAAEVGGTYDGWEASV